MMLLKACPRCRRGDLVVEREEYGLIVNCLQCGYIGDPSTARRSVARTVVTRASLRPDKVSAA